MIPEIRNLVDEADFKSDELRELHRFLLQYPDSVYSEKNMLDIKFIWDNRLPMRQFLFHRLQRDQVSYPIGWAKVGLLFEEYAWHIGWRHSLIFDRVYLSPSAYSIFKFREIDEWKNSVKSEKFIEDFFKIPPVDYEHNGAIFAPVNFIRHVANYFYWVLIILSELYFFVRLRYFAKKDKSQFLFLIALVTFVYLSVIAEIIFAPTVSWRDTLYYYLPSLAFMMIMADDIWGNVEKYLDARRRKSALASSAVAE